MHKNIPQPTNLPYFSETAFNAAVEPKELMIIKGANHVDLYDQIDVIPFDKLTDFFQKNLSPSTNKKAPAY